MTTQSLTIPGAHVVREKKRQTAGLATLRRLLGYVGPHKRYAALTVAFGALGFVLSFVYPWIIGSVVDVIVAPATNLTYEAREARLLGYTELAAVTAVLHAIVVYGRGHFNVHLGHSVVVDIRRDLFEHIQGLSLLFFTKERTGSILSRVVHDVHEATSLVYMGLIVAGLDALQLVVSMALLAHISAKLTLACMALFPL